MSEDLVLYVYPGKRNLPSPSPPCSKAMLALAYSQLPHRVEHVKADPRKVSPTGRLPALVIEGETVCDSVEILDRLEALDPPRRFWPEDPRERARDQVWERYANEHLYWRAVYLRWLVPENANRTCAALLPKLPPIVRTILPIVAKREVRRRAAGQGVGLYPPEQVRAQVQRALDTYLAGLGDGPFLEERAEPGRADLAAAAHLPQLAYESVTPWAEVELKQRPKLIAYVGRVYEACGLPVPDCLA